MSDTPTLVSDLVVGPLGAVWLERDGEVVSVVSERDDLECGSCRPAWVRPGNGGVLAVSRESVFVRESAGWLVRLRPGRPAERVARLPGLESIVGSPQGELVAALTRRAVIVFDAGGSVVDAIGLETLGLSRVTDVALDDDGSIALSTAGTWDAWRSGEVVVVRKGAVEARRGSSGESCVEPRFANGRLWVRSDEGGAHVPVEFDVVGPSATVPYDIGEYPLGPGRRGYAVASERVLGVVASLEQPAVVSGAGPSWTTHAAGRFTSLWWDHGELCAIRLGPASAHVVRGDRELAGSTWELAPIEFTSLRRLGTSLPGVALVPPRPRALAIAVHGGPVEQVGLPLPEKWLRVARRGVLVVAPDYPGSYGYGRAWREAIVGGYGEVEVSAIATLLEELETVVDGPRIGLGASSAGWTLIQLVLREPRLLDALVLTNPLLAPSELPETAWLESPVARVRSQQRPARSIPVLITSGTHDQVVPCEQTVAFCERLAGSLELVSVVAPGEGHSLSPVESAREAARLDALLAGLLATWGGRH